MTVAIRRRGGKGEGYYMSCEGRITKKESVEVLVCQETTVRLSYD